VGWEKHEAGAVVVDGWTHIAVRKLTGRHAHCGAGRIVVMIPSGFDPGRPSACPRCSAATVPWQAEAGADVDADAGVASA
jgi:hypothetical protein